MTEPTGERMLPDRQRGELVHAEHTSRYRYAAQFAAGKRVLDAACGEGYGSQLLQAARAASVTGVDIDETTVAAAREKYDARFERSDVGSMPFDDDSFDLIISFETIEHVENAEAVIAEFRRVLAPGGTLIISTPNSSEYEVKNEFHKREFNFEEFGELIGDRFGPVHWLHQQNWLLSAVLDETQFALDDDRIPLDIDVFKAAGRARGQELYILAVCGPRLVEAREIGYAADIYEANKLLEWIDRARHAEELLQSYVERCEKAEALLAAHVERCDEAERSIERLERKIEVLEGRGLNKLVPLYREIKRRRAAD